MTDMLLSSENDQAFNVQAQYVGSPGSKWTGSFGIQDIGGGGGSSGDGLPGDSRTSRSFFVVATYRWQAGSEPANVSLGGGTRRLRQGVVNLSRPFFRPLRIWTEYEGFGFNAGGLLTTNMGRGKSGVELNVLLGVMKMRYAVGAVVIGF
jgi:hypothetical protein